MNGEAGKMLARENRTAMRRVMGHFPLWTVLFALVWSGVPLTINATTGNLGGSLFAVFFAVVWVAYCRDRFSGAVIHLLPVRRRDLGKGIWLMTLFYPMLLLAVLFLFGAGFSVMFFHATAPEAGGKVALALVQLLALLGMMTAGPCLRGAFGVWSDNGLVRVPPKRANAQLLGMLHVAAVGAWVLCTSPGYADRELVAALCAVVGMAGAISAYLLREHLVEDALRRGGKSGAGPGGYDFGRSVPDWSRGTLLRHFLWTVLFSMAVATGAAFNIDITLSRHGAGAGIVSLGFLFGGNILCLVVGWSRWPGSLREWRMLPLDRGELGRRISGTALAACVVPWLAALSIFGALEVSRQLLSIDQCVLGIGLSAILQGMVLAVLPLALRQFKDSVGKLVCACLAVAAACVVLSLLGFYAPEIEPIVDHPPTAYAWPLLATGVAALCAGGVVSGWHAGRMLRHSDCYRKPVE